MAGQAFTLGTALPGPIHKLRYTRAGIAYLQQTGGFRDYMQDLLDAKKKPFLAWDGEGWSDHIGEHRYMLLQNSLGGYINAPQLDTAACLEFMLSTAAKHPGYIHVIYGGGYDATHILRDLPLELRVQLKDNNPVVYSVPQTATTMRNRYTIKYLPHKWLEISGYDWATRSNAKIKIFDVMTFFQTSFIKALQSRKIAVPDVITTGKATRADFTYDDIAEIRTYCQQELELLVTLCGTLRDEFDSAGITVTQFHGPGAVASSIYKQYGVRNHMQPPSLELEQAAQHAYFGGHFEQYKAGHYDGPTYLYDINSAYPYQIADLPSLVNSIWSPTDRFYGQPGVWLCSFDATEYGDYITPNPLPWRGPGGEVGFPSSNTAVWVWHHEAALATTVHHGLELHTANETKPFSFVPDMYATRRAMQAAGNGGERALKLALNSLYGKQAQRVGGSDKYGGRPPWHQIEWAGMATSGTRRQLWDAIQLAPPDTVIAVETDSIMTTAPLPLDIGTALGQWGETRFDWVTYVQSGIYFTSAETGVTHGSKARTRGIDVTQLHHDEVLRFMDTDQTEPLLVKSRQFIGLGNPRNYLYGQWQDGVKEVRVGGQKRLHAKRSCRACAESAPMSQNLHDLIANPLYGIAPSAPHTLPWLNDEPVELEPDRVYVGEAIETYDVQRRVNRV